MESKYRIRVQAIAIADDNGSHAPDVSAGAIKARLLPVNEIFAPANIEFVFNEQTDFLKINSTVHNRDFTVLEPPNLEGGKWDHNPKIDKVTHQQARNELAKQFPGRVVMIFHHREEIKKEDDASRWSIVFNDGGSSGGTDFYLEGSEDLAGVHLAHELGHYLQLPHTFEGGVANVDQAATKIRKYVEDDGHKKEDGLDALDGDRAIALDTPADVASGIWESEGLNKCGRVGKISIPVEFNDGSERTYTLQPDRSNVMSYFKGCSGEKTFSPQQVRRMRDSLELRLRHQLISIKPSFSHRIQRGGTGLAGAIESVACAVIRFGRLTTAVHLGDGRLKLIVWDINEAGSEVARRGDAAAGTVKDFSVSSLGQNMFATAVTTPADRLKVTLWRVDENGDVTRLGSQQRPGTIRNTAISMIKYGIGAGFFATASQRVDHRIALDVWEARADGSLIHKVSDACEPPFSIPASATAPQLAMSAVGFESVACHHVHESMHYTTLLWGYNQGDNRIVEKARLVNAFAKVVGSCSPARELSVAAVRDVNDTLKLLAFRCGADGKWMEAGGIAGDAEIANIDVCPVGTEMVATGHRRGEGSNRLKVILWQVTKSGSNIIRLADFAAEEEFSLLSMCQTNRSQFATAIRDSAGKLRVIAWRVVPDATAFPGTSVPIGDIVADLPSPVGRREPASTAPGARPANSELDDNCDTDPDS